MPYGSARILMSSSSTTTSNLRRSQKPPDSRVYQGVSRFSGRLDRAGFRRDSAGDPLQMPPAADQGTSADAELPRYAWKSISMRCRLSASLGGPEAQRPACSKSSPGGFDLAGALGQAGMAAARATASKYSATVPGRVSTWTIVPFSCSTRSTTPGHRDGVVVTDHHDALGGDHGGVASFGQPCPDVAGLVFVVEVDLKVDHNCTAAHGAHLLLDRSGTYLGLSRAGPKISSKSFSSSSSGRRAPPGGRNRTVQ